MKKLPFYSELAYIVGILFLAFGTALITKADFGLSMIVAPAYLIHLKVSQYLPFFSFGMAEYVFQALLILLMCLIVRRFRVGYLFSFVTAVLYGLTLDAMVALTAALPADGYVLRAVYFAVGLVFCTAGVALLLNTYLAPEAYELFVKEICYKFHYRIDRFKTFYDFSSCLLAIVLSFLFFGFGRFVGINFGTIICAVLNGWLIGCFGRFFLKRLAFRDLLPLRKYFEGDEK